MTRTRTTLTALAVAVILVAAGCGSSDDDGADNGSDQGTEASSAELPVALSGKVNVEGTEDVSDKGDTVTVEMELDDNSFEPTFIKAAPGQTVTVELENEGANPHTFTLDDDSSAEEVAPGEKATVEVTVPDSGSLRFSCDFHGSMGMQGAFYTGTGASSGSGGSTDGSTTTTDDSSRGGSGY
jgi:plastocyanin